MDSTTVDSGPRGFLDIMRGDDAAAAPSDTERSDDVQVETTAAEATSPETANDADLSADEVIAARFAALDDTTVAAPDTDETETETAAEDQASHPLLATPTGEPSLDSLTPEQLRVLAEEAIRLRNEVTTNSRHEAARKVAAAEAAAVAQVQAAFEREVLAVSEAHYTAIFDERMEKIEELSEDQPRPALYRKIEASKLRRLIDAAKQQWESQQAEQWEQRAKAAAIAARKNVPEVRQLYAAELLRQAGLPEAAVPQVLTVPDTDGFPARVEELVGIRDALLAERNRNQAQLRKQANKTLIETTPRTAVTGRPPGGKPPEYRGSKAEGARLLALMRQP